MNANCPRCQTPLVNNQVDEFSVRLCPPCQGLLLPHPDVVKIFDRSWHAVKPEDAEKLDFHVPSNPRTGTTLLCPDCHKPMAEYGYMGLAAIPIDRCDPCSLLWLDADELQNMVLALAKTNYRSESARLKEWRTTADGFVSTAIAGLAAPGAHAWRFGRRGSGVEIVVAEALLSIFDL